jgi:hypothetical protein
MNLRDAAYGPRPTGVRRLWALVEGLPPTGALGRAMRDDWSPGSTEYLLAIVAEQIDLSNRIAIKAHSGGKSRAGQPLRIPRPGEEKRSKPMKFGDVLRRVEEVSGGEGR